MIICTYLFIFIIGAMLGSFFNVCIYRLPRGEGIIFPGSHCPKCQAQLKPWDNIPILSYIFLRGKCRYCNGIISSRYILVESITGLLYLGLYLRFGLGVEFFYYILLFIILCSNVEVIALPARFCLLANLPSHVWPKFLVSFI